MIKIICNDNIKENLIEDFYRLFAEMCLNGIGLLQDDNWENNIQLAIDAIKAQDLLEIEEVDNGIEIYETTPDEVGLCILDEFDMGNSYYSSFTSDNACMEFVFNKLCEDYPSISANVEVEYDDGISCMGEKIIVKKGAIVSSEWIDDGFNCEEDDDDEDEDYDE